MLPLTFFERLSSAYGLKTTELPRERRRSIRTDFRGLGEIHGVASGVVGVESPIRMREISRGGCSFLAPRKMRIGETFLLTFFHRDQGVYWFFCVVRRSIEKDRLSHLVGCEFVKLLYPGQHLAVGTFIGHLVWVDVQGDRVPPDPMELRPADA